MNDKFDFSIFDTGDGKKCEAALARLLAEQTQELCGIKSQLKAKVESQFQEPAQVLGQAWSKMIDAIMHPCAQAARGMQTCENKIRTWIEAQLNRGQGVLSLCEAKVRKAAKRCEKKAQAKENAPSKPVKPPESPLQAPSLPPEPFPPPPTPEELAGLLIPFPDGSGAIELSQLPAELWDSRNTQCFWLSLEPTPVSRVQASTLRFDGTTVKPAGTVFFNIGMPMDLAAIKSLLRAFGLPDDSYMAVGQEEAWKLNSEAFGGLLTGQIWDYFAIPHPAVMPTIGAGLVMQGGDGLETGQVDHQDKGPEGQQGQFPPGLQQQLPQIPFLPPALQPRVPQLGNVQLPQLPQLRLPTHAELCAALDPIYEALNVPRRLRVPCVSMAEAKAALLGMLGDDEVGR